MSDHSYSFILKRAAEVEDLLKRLGATGKGLRELSDSIRDQLSAKVYSDIRALARVRNRRSHEVDYEPSGEALARYDERYQRIVAALNAMLEPATEGEPELAREQPRQQEEALPAEDANKSSERGPWISVLDPLKDILVEKVVDAGVGLAGRAGKAILVGVASKIFR